MSNGNFEAVVYALIIIYALLATVGVVQIARLLHRDEGAFYGANRFFPRTVQQLIHFLILMLTTVRVCFFSISLEAWDPSNGEVIQNKGAFYGLDEVSNVLLFSVTSVLVLFWAELYYISTNAMEVFTYVVRPSTYFINVAALLVVLIFTGIVSISSENDVDYIFLQYTVLTCTIYLIAAVMFAYYANAVAEELKQVPIMLSARRQRLRSLRAIAFISITALVAKAAILIYLTGRSIKTSTSGAVCGVFFYYFLCEVCPLSVILWFYRVEEIGPRGAAFNMDDEEEEGNSSKTTSSAERAGESTPLTGNSTGRGTARLMTSPLRGVGGAGNKSASPAIIDALIARLSLESGEIPEEQREPVAYQQAAPGHADSRYSAVL